MLSLRKLTHVGVSATDHMGRCSNFYTKKRSIVFTITFQNLHNNKKKSAARSRNKI